MNIVIIAVIKIKQNRNILECCIPLILSVKQYPPSPNEILELWPYEICEGTMYVLELIRRSLDSKLSTIAFLVTAH